MQILFASCKMREKKRRYYNMLAPKVRDVVGMRRRIRDAFLSQLDGKRIPVAPVAPDASVRRPPHRSGFG